MSAWGRHCLRENLSAIFFTSTGFPIGSSRPSTRTRRRNGQSDCRRCPLIPQAIYGLMRTFRSTAHVCTGAASDGSTASSDQLASAPRRSSGAASSGRDSSATAISTSMNLALRSELAREVAPHSHADFSSSSESHTGVNNAVGDL